MKRKYVLIICLSVTFIILGVLTFTYAKFAKETVWDYYLNSKGFYLSSDYLGETPINNVDNLWDGSSVHFNIRNNLNEEVITTYDISYTVACTLEGAVANNATCKVNGTALSTQDGVLSIYETCHNNTDDGVDVSGKTKSECEIEGYNWVNEIASSDLYFDIVPNEEGYELTDAVAIVTVNSTAPYSKTLSGRFTLHKKEEVTNPVDLEFNNYSNYNELIVTNASDNSKCINISWDAEKLKIESTNFISYTENANKYINSIKINIPSRKALKYTFYTNSTLDVNEFTLAETTGCE